MIGYNNSDVLQCLRQYEMFSNSLKLIKNNNERSMIIKQLTKLEERIIALTNEAYLEEYNALNNKECGLLDEEKNRLTMLIDLINQRLSYVEKRCNNHYALTGESIDVPMVVGSNKLDELEANYSIVYKGVTDFENYIDSLKNTAEEAYNLISVYYYQVKEAEKTLEEIDIESLSSLYKEKIEAVYEVLNDIHKEVQSKPINVEEVNNKIVNLKNVANAMFEDIDNKARLAKLAERTLVALNSDRDEQDVNQTVKQFESGFYKGEFQSVYSQANSLYKNRHSDNEAR